MFDRILEHPLVYQVSQWCLYRSGQSQRYVTDWVRPKPGDRVLDIGCGPADFLHRMPAVDYTGYDPNHAYIEKAQRRWGTRGRFSTGPLETLCSNEAGRFDLVMANGVLHHVTDAEAESILALARRVLKPGGRMVTRDGCYEPGQSLAARFLLRADRGKYVRPQAAYDRLLRPHFEILRTAIVRDALRLPYSLIHFELRKAPAGGPSINT